MQEVEPSWKHGMVLVCTHERDPSTGRASCGRKAGTVLRTWLKHQVRSGDGPGSEGLVATSGCLGVCPEHGVTVALPPETQCLVVDPEHDKEALLERVRAHLDAQAAAPDPGRGGLLGRARARLKRHR